MPRYLFNVNDGETFKKDDEGVELPDLDAVREEAVAAVKDITAGKLKQGAAVGVVSERSFDVTDESGRTVLNMPFKVALQTEGPHR